MHMEENKMGTMPVGKLLYSMALPMIISMMVQALYNIVDSMYVSRISEAALTAVSLVFPIQNLMIAIATGTGVGINALLSRALGAKQFDKADKAAQHGVFLGIVSSLVIMVLMFFLASPFMSVQTDDPVIHDGGVVYLRICCCVSIGLFVQIMMERLLASTGRTNLTMISQLAGAIINIIMDPVMIFGYGPFPEMGIAGAAAATVLDQCIGALIGIWLNHHFNHEISLTRIPFRIDPGFIREVYAIAVPSIVMVSIGSLMTFGMNMILMQQLNSPTGAAVFGVYFKLNSIIFMPVFGLNNAMVPIIAYNYGAKHKARIKQTIRDSVIFGEAVMLIGFGFFQLMPDRLLAIFNASEEMTAIGTHALRVISLSFLFAGICVVLSSVMQAMGKAFYSMITSIARQLVILLPSAWILAKLSGLDAVWWSFDIAEIASLLLMTAFYRRTKKQLIDPLPE